MTLGALPRELAQLVQAFLTLDEAVVLVGCASTATRTLEQFLPPAHSLDARVPDCRSRLRSERRQHASRRYESRSAPCLDRSACVYHNGCLRSLLLTQRAYARLAETKFSVTEALEHLSSNTTDLASRQRVAIDILTFQVQRRQLNRFTLAQTFAVALRQSLHDVVDWILSHAAITTLPLRLRVTVLLSSCQYDVVEVGTRVVQELLRQSPPSGEVLQSLLATAARCGRCEVVCLVLDNLVSLDHLDGDTLQSALDAAAQGGHLAVLRHLLSTAQALAIIPNARDALAGACKCAHREIVHFLLASPLVVISNSAPASAMSPLAAAVEGGASDLITTILADSRVNRWDALAFQRAVGDGNASVVKQLLMLPQCRAKDVEIALRSFPKHQAEGDVVRQLIAHGCWKQRPEAWELLDIVCSHGDIGVIEHVLSTCASIDRKYWRPLVTAARNGHDQVVRRILEGHGVWQALSVDKSIDSDAERAEALLAACHRGHLLAAQELLPNVGIDMIQLLRVVEAAAAAPSSAVLDWLISNHDAIVSQCDLDAALQYACAHGRTDAARLLLNHRRVHFADGLSIQFAATCDALELVTLLLADPRVTEQYDLQAALIDAAREGHARIVELLLADPRLRITNGAAIHEAADRGHVHVLKLLLQAPVMWSNPEVLDLHLAYTCAACHAHYAALFVLLDDPRVPLPRNGAVSRVDGLPKRPGDTSWCTFLRRFFRHPRVDPAADDNQLLMDACLHAKRGVVQALLWSGRVAVDATVIDAVDDLVRLTSAPMTNHMPAKLVRRYRLLAQDLQHHLDRIKTARTAPEHFPSH